MGSVEEIYESEIHRTITRRTSYKIHEVNHLAYMYVFIVRIVFTGLTGLEKKAHL